MVQVYQSQGTALRDPDLPNKGREPGVVTDPVPGLFHLEEDEPRGSLGEGRLEARECLLALPYLGLEAGQVAGGDIPLLREGLELAESTPRHRRFRALVILLTFCGPERRRSVLLPRALVR